MERLSRTIGSIREHVEAWFKVVSIVLVLSFIFFIAGGGVSHNKKWLIERIDISGTDTATIDTMRSLVRQELEGSYFFVYSHANSYLFPKGDIGEMLLETFPRMKEVSVSRSDNHTLSIVVVERERYALWCGEEFHPELSAPPVCWFIDGNGFVFDHAPIFSRGVYVETYGELIEINKDEPLRGSLPYRRFVTANNFAKLLYEKIGKPFLIEIKPEGELEVYIQTSGKYPFLADVAVRFKDETNPETLINNLLKAIPVQFPDGIAPQKKLHYIDMRFGNKVIFGFE